MKKLILIWVGVIVVLIVGGIIYGKITGMNEEPEIPQTEITYKDDNGNNVVEKVDDLPIEVVIEGEKYKYNSAIWKGKPLVVDGVQFESPHYMDTYESNGFKNNQYGVFTKDENHNLYIQYNSYYGYIFSVSAYAEPYNSVSHMNYAYCDDLVLPANIKLGESTKEYVESIYGESANLESKQEGYVTVKYYATADKRGEILQLTYTKDTGILIGITWTFDVSNLG